MEEHDSEEDEKDIVELDKRYIKLCKGNLKAAVFLAVVVRKQIEFNQENEPDRFGHNFWPMGIEEFKEFGLGTNKPQKIIRDFLDQYDFFRQRIWGRYRRPGKYKEGRSCPPRMEYFVDIELLGEELLKIDPRMNLKSVSR